MDYFHTTHWMKKTKHVNTKLRFNLEKKTKREAKLKFRQNLTQNFNVNLIKIYSVHGGW